MTADTIPAARRPDHDDPAATTWALVERVQAGDTQAFAGIYERYFDTVFRFIRYRVDGYALAEDLTADVFAKALRSIGAVQWQGRDIGAWLITIARNLVFDYRKSAVHQRVTSVADIFDAAEPADGSCEGDPEGTTVNTLTAERLWSAVARLPEDQRRVLQLRFRDGLSVLETAAVLGRNEGATKALQWRAVRALARKLPPGLAEVA